MITDWFENEVFVAQLIKAGVEGLLNKSASNIGGLIAYNMDETYINDAKEISRLVKQHNEVTK